MGYVEFRDSEWGRQREEFDAGRPVPTVYSKKFELEDALKDDRLHPAAAAEAGAPAAAALAAPDATTATFPNEVQRAIEAGIISNVKAREDLGLDPEPEAPDPASEWVGMSEVL